MNRTAVLCLSTAAAALVASAVLAQPATPDAAPQPAPAAAAPLPAPPPPPPPTGEAAQLIGVLNNVCLPLVTGGDVKAIARTQALRKNRDGSYMLKLEGAQAIVVTPSPANPSICSLTINFEVGQQQPLVDALAGWAATRPTPLDPRDQAYKTAGFTSWSWTADTAAGHQGLVFNMERTADGQPIGKGYDVATVLYSDR